MSLQERVLEVLDKQSAVPAKDLMGLFPDVDRNALDCCLNALRRNNTVLLGAGQYSLVRPITSIRVTAPVPEPSSPAPLAEKPTEEPPTRRCRECRETKPLEDYPEIGPQKRRAKTCQVCRERIAAAKRELTISDGVFVKVRQKKQDALNRLTVLRVDIANLEAEVAECDEFIRLYERFSQEAG